MRLRCFGADSQKAPSDSKDSKEYNITQILSIICHHRHDQPARSAQPRSRLGYRRTATACYAKRRFAACEGDHAIGAYGYDLMARWAHNRRVVIACCVTSTESTLRSRVSGHPPTPRI